MVKSVLFFLYLTIIGANVTTGMFIFTTETRSHGVIIYQLNVIDTEF